MDKLKMSTPDLTDNNIEQIGALFPNVITETRDENGAVKKAVDFDLLKQALSKNLVEDDNERYRLDWPGKKASLIKANTPITKTLRPCREESVNFDTTENLYVEGDNFEVLKILQESYLGKIKMIYIDPPYNTGNDFIYKDNFAKSKDEYEEELGATDEEGGKLFKNTDSNGRFHSDWLSMMYERLVVARDLLQDEGAVFISINDNEVHNLRKICDEIFGEENFLVSFSWKTDGNFDNQAKFKICHEYILGYAKIEQSFVSPPAVDPSIPTTSKLFKEEIRNTIVKNGPKNPISEVVLPVGFPADFADGTIEERNDSWPHYHCKAVIKDGLLTNTAKISSGWSSKDLLTEFLANDCKPVRDIKGQESRFVISQTGALEVVKKRSDTQSHVISSLFNLGGAQKASAEIQALELDYFDYPKPVSLVKYLCQMVKGENDIILDFFSGSATTAHAVMQLNAEDGGNRKFIMVQLPEPCDEKSEAFKAGYKSIAEIGKERIRRAGKKILEELEPRKAQKNTKKNQQTLFDSSSVPSVYSVVKNLDIGFRVYKTDSTNMKDVFYHPSELKQHLLPGLESNIKEDRTAEDLLTQVILDLGLELTLPIETKKILGNTVFIIQTNALVACFDNDIDFKIVDTISDLKPLKVVFKDASFKDDKDRINVEERFKRLSLETKVTVI